MRQASLYALLSAAAARTPDRCALVVEGEAIAYRELHGEVVALASHLGDTGLMPGERVVIFAGNTRECVVAFWATLAAGGVAVVLHPDLRGQKLGWLLDDCQPAAAVVDGRLANVAVAALQTWGHPLPLVVVGEPSVALPNARPWDDVMRLDRGSASTLPEIEASALAALIYTSGSTGEPKAVAVTHANMGAAAASIAGYLGLREQDVLLGVLPLSFDYGLYQAILAASVGACLVLERSFGLPGPVLNRIAERRVTVLPGVPTLFAMLARLGDLGRWDLSSVRLVTSTAAALGPEQIRWIRDTFTGAELFSMYGLTECKRCTYLPPADLDRKPGSVGIAIPGNEIWLVDEADRRVPACEVGELVVRGPTVMAGYWRRPEETARSLRPGPRPGERVLYTGDLCRMDADGYLYFVRRTDDVIKSCGEKVAPAEVEAVLRSLPGVLDAAVVGMPDSLLGQAVHAFVVLEVGSTLQPAALRDGCRARLEPFMVPRTVTLVAELPRTAHGKVERRALV